MTNAKNLFNSQTRLNLVNRIQDIQDEITLLKDELENLNDIEQTSQISFVKITTVELEIQALERTKRDLMNKLKELEKEDYSIFLFKDSKTFCGTYLGIIELAPFQMSNNQIKRAIRKLNLKVNGIYNIEIKSIEIFENRIEAYQK